MGAIVHDELLWRQHMLTQQIAIWRSVYELGAIVAILALVAFIATKAPILPPVVAGACVLFTLYRVRRAIQASERLQENWDAHEDL
jgi:hypothetical protein